MKMRLDVTLYSALALIGLAAAYWASLPTTDDENKRIGLFSVEPKAVTRLVYTSENNTTVAERRSEDGRFWITETTKKLPKGAKKGTPLVEQTQKFLSSDKLTDIISDFSPFEALRVLGKIEGEGLKEFGLEDSKETFVIDSSNNSFEFVIGKKSYGSANRFVIEKQEGRVVLVDSKPIDSLSKAYLRLFERKLADVDYNEVDKVTVKAGEKSKVLAHTIRGKKGSLEWSDDVEGAAPKGSYRSWMNKVERLRLINFASDSTALSLASVKPFLELVIHKGDAVKDTIVLKKLKNESGKLDYWVNSGYLKAYARLSANRAGAVEKDISAIIGK